VEREGGGEERERGERKERERDMRNSYSEVYMKLLWGNERVSE
jgi:hypothetical protein